jgi:preprotein translocase subunit SecY
VLDALRNTFRIGDLRSKILYTGALLLVYRIGAHVPVPGVDARALANMLGVGEGGAFGFLDLFSGGALGRFTVFAMGVSPYITASIIVQLLQVAVPQLEEMAKEGVEGRKKLQQYTRYGTIVLALIQAISVTLLARSWQVIANPNFFTLTLIVMTLTAGTCLLMWLGEKITQRGIGNGISMLIFTGIIAGLPYTTFRMFQAVGQGGISFISVVIYMVLAVGIIAGTVMVQEGQRRIPVQYAKKVVGRRMYGGQSTHIPLRVNTAGVIPVIFASSVLLIPQTIGQFIPAVAKYFNWLSIGTLGYNIVYIALIIFFTYFYTAITFNPVEVANNMKKNGGFIPGLRPGRPTAEYMDRVLSRITLFGAIFLAIIAVMPNIVAAITRIPMSFIAFGGTSLLIVVGVALDTMKQIEAHLLLRHYEGFMK